MDRAPHTCIEHHVRERFFVASTNASRHSGSRQILIRSQLPDAHATTSYLLAVAGPLAMGSLKEVTGSWTTPILLVLVVLVVEVVAGVIAARPVGRTGLSGRCGERERVAR